MYGIRNLYRLELARAHTDHRSHFQIGRSCIFSHRTGPVYRIFLFFLPLYQICNPSVLTFSNILYSSNAALEAFNWAESKLRICKFFNEGARLIATYICPSENMFFINIQQCGWACFIWPKWPAIWFDFLASTNYTISERDSLNEAHR